MKKKLVLSTALSTMLLASSACFAASTQAAGNPFTDVPQDHWAYDAVSQLAQDGVIEGYGDATFHGNKAITRYEMAQMVAKAMAKTDVSAADKALIDKLSAEFSRELDNLGVRVSKLERNADRVKWSGIFAQKAMRGNTDKNTWWEKELFLNADASVNSDWKVHAGIDTKWGTNTDGFNGEKEFSDKYGSEDHEVSNMIYHLYAQGPLFKGSTATFGLFTPSLQDGVVGNARTKGGELDYRIGKTTVKAYAGKLHEKNADLSSSWSGFFRRGGGLGDFEEGNPAEGSGGFYDRNLNVVGGSLEQNFDGRTSAGIGYYALKNSYAYNKGDDTLGIFAVNARHTLAKNLELTGFYSHGNQHYQNKAYDAKLIYNGSPWGSRPWGMSLGYRYLGSDALIMTSIVNGSEKPGMKGLEGTLWFHFAPGIQLQNYFFNGTPINDTNNIYHHRTAYFSSLIFSF